jgi:hypothetical protein
MSDIGQILFVDILKMSSYPGSPFSGNMVNDMVMFLFIPTVIIILFIYVIMQRLNIGNAPLRLLFGLAIYSYIIVGGFYQAFALAVGPYFLILIFILGLFYFITAHFRVGGHAHGSAESLGGINDISNIRKIRHYLGIGELNPVNRDWLTRELTSIEERIRRLEEDMRKSGGGDDRTKIHLDHLRATAQEIREKLYGRAA